MARPKRATAFSPVAKTVAAAVSIPAPVGGLNVLEGMAAMDPRYAIQMENLWPTAWGVWLRKGWQQHCVVTGVVHTLMNYAAPTGAENLFAAVESTPGTCEIYDVTASSASPPQVHTSVYAHIQSALFTNVFGHYLICVSGAETPYHYNGTTWADLVITGDLGDAETDPTPLDPTLLIDVNIFKRRVWFVEKDSTRAWYLGVDEIQGAASMFDLGEIFPRGGYLAEIGTWTVDTGTGINDNIIFVSSEGDLAMFSGIDPDSDFVLTGVYTVAAPMNRRSLAKRGGDLLLATREGVMSMAAIMAEQSELEARTITNLIKPLLSSIANDAVSLLDWQIFTVSKYEMVIYNTRDTSSTISQFVLNSTTKAWTQFTNVFATCWGLWEEEPFFGGSGVVGRFWVGAYDGTSLDGSVNGNYIEGKAIQAYSYFGSPGQQKHFRLVRPVFRAASEPAVSVAVLVDYSTTNSLVAPPPTSAAYPYGLWDVSLWDQALWGQNSISIAHWYGAGQIGMAGAVVIALQATTVGCVWVSTDILIEAGGVI